MKFVDAKDIVVSDAEKTGKVDYVAWYRHVYQDHTFISMFPNGKTVKNRSLIAMADDPEIAWELVLGSKELINKFGIQI